MPHLRPVLIAAALLGLVTACAPQPQTGTPRELDSRGLYAAAITPDGSNLLAGGIASGPALWGREGSEPVATLELPGEQLATLTAAAVAADGRTGITVEPARLGYWDLNSGQPLGQWGLPALSVSAALSGDGRIALIGSDNGRADLYDLQRRGRLRVLEHSDRVGTVALSRDGTLALTGCDDRRARLWRVADGALLQEIDHGNTITTVAFSGDGRLAFSAGALEQGRIWRTADGALVTEMDPPLLDLPFVPTPRRTFTAARFLDDGRQLLLGRPDGLVELRKVADGSVIQSWQAHHRDRVRPTGAAILAVTRSPDGAVHGVAANGFSNLFR